MLFLIDLDGTLIDSEPFHYQTWGKILNESPSYIENIVNTIGMNDFLENYKDRDVLRKHKLNEMLKVKGIKLIKNADKFINFITNHNINHVVVTNSNRELVEHFKREVPELNKLKNWITREDYNKPKPDSECYELAVKLYGEHENKIIGFENSIHGINALSHITENIFYICEKTE